MIALSSGSLYNYGTARVFELAAQAGYDGMEVLVDQRWDTRHPAYLRRLSDDYGLPILAVHNPFVFGVAGWPDDQLGRLQRTVALAQELGVPTVVTHLPFRFHAIMGHWHAYRMRPFRLWRRSRVASLTTIFCATAWQNSRPRRALRLPSRICPATGCWGARSVITPSTAPTNWSNSHT